jgi:hypothetical protein
VKGISTEMAQKSEYKVISEKTAGVLQTKIVQASVDGWKPILITSAAVDKTLVITVILEHVLGT